VAVGGAPLRNWEHEHFIVVPVQGVAPYNREFVENIIGRRIGTIGASGEGWHGFQSMIFRVRCDKQLFDKLCAEIKKIYTDFGGREENLHYYLAGNASRL
jgi:hypothetical protein